MLELSARLSRPVSAPEGVLFLTVVYLAFRVGASSGLLAALVSDLYLVYCFISPLVRSLGGSPRPNHNAIKPARLLTPNFR